MEIPGSKELGQVIRVSRKKKALTQEEFGIMIGKSKRTIQHYEAGTTAIPFAILLLMSEKLEISITALLPDYWEELKYSISFLQSVLQRDPTYEEIANEADLPLPIVSSLMKENRDWISDEILKKPREESRISATDLADFLKVMLKHEGVDQVVHVVKNNNLVFCLFFNTGEIYIVSYDQAVMFWEQSRSFGCAFLQKIMTNSQKAILAF